MGAGRHRGHRLQPIDRDRPGAQEPRHQPRDVQDRGGDAAGRRTTVEDDGYGAAELLLGFVRCGRGGPARDVRAAHRQRPGLLEQVQRDLVHRHPDRHGAPGLAEVPAQRAVGPADQGELAGPELLDQGLARVARVLDQRRRRADRPDEHRRRHLAAAALGHEQPRDGGRHERVRADAVDGVGGQHDEPTAFEGTDRRSDAGLPLFGVGAVEHVCHASTPTRSGPRSYLAAILTRARLRVVIATSPAARPAVPSGRAAGSPPHPTRRSAVRRSPRQ